MHSIDGAQCMECRTCVPLWFSEHMFGVRKNDMIDISYICLSNMPYNERYLFTSHDTSTCIVQFKEVLATVLA